MLRRLRTIAGHPLTPFILIFYVALDLVCIGSRYGWRSTDASKLLYEPLFSRPKWSVSWVMAAVTRGDDQSLILLCQDQREWESRPDLLAPSRVVDYISVFPDPRSDCGTYAPTYSRLDLTPTDFQPGSLTPAQQSDFRRQFLEHWVARRIMPTDLSSEERSRFIAGQSVIRVTHLPLGYLHNTLSLTIFAMLCWSLRLNIPKLWRRRADPTKCPHCRYSTIGLTTDTCPECGHRIPAPT